MEALVYNDPGKKSVDERQKPEISAPTDAVVELVRTTICGTDLHILKGDVPTCAPGRILGHEGVGVVVAIVGAGPIGPAALQGVSASFITCEDIVAPGGVIANVGVHGVKADLHPQRLWDRDRVLEARRGHDVMSGSWV